MRVETVRIGPKVYPLSWSMSCIETLEDLYGGVDKIQEKLNGSNKIAVLFDLVHSMIVSGCAYVNAWKLKPSGVEFDEYGKIHPCSREAVASSIVSESDIEALMNKVQKVVTAAGSRKINATVPANSKKKKAGR